MKLECTWCYLEHWRNHFAPYQFTAMITFHLFSAIIIIDNRPSKSFQTLVCICLTDTLRCTLFDRCFRVSFKCIKKPPTAVWTPTQAQELNLNRSFYWLLLITTLNRGIVGCALVLQQTMREMEDTPQWAIVGTQDQSMKLTSVVTRLSQLNEQWSVFKIQLRSQVSNRTWWWEAKGIRCALVLFNIILCCNFVLFWELAAHFKHTLF